MKEKIVGLWCGECGEYFNHLVVPRLEFKTNKTILFCSCLKCGKQTERKVSVDFWKKVLGSKVNDTSADDSRFQS